MEWDRASILRLISLYEQKKLLWKASHAHYFNKSIRNEAWEDISQKMHIDVDACKKKMTSLLAAVRRERIKIKKNIGSGKGKKFYYALLIFTR